MGNLKLLHLGCANRYYEGFINSDKDTHSRQGTVYKLDAVMDLAEPWPYETESIDGITSMHVLQQLTWRQLAFVALPEAYRVLKKGSVMRMGMPVVEIEDKSLEYILGWNNINLFSIDLLKQVFVNRIGFSEFVERGYHSSSFPELTRIDNRRGRGTRYFEAIK